jgi:flavin reductase (DIM6/NTAB) family NADH-FMN oxidoreductase RutF
MSTVDSGCDRPNATLQTGGRHGGGRVSIQELRGAPATGVAEGFRASFGRFPAGVAVVGTLAADRRPVGFTATSLASVSVDPPLLSFNIGLRTSSWPAVSAATHVGVSLLGAHQEDVARRFATSGIDRFAGTAWRLAEPGVPLLDTALAHLVCRVERRYPAGDHTLVLALVLRADPGHDGDPLLYHAGAYRRPAGP